MYYMDTNHGPVAITTRKLIAHGALPPDQIYAAFGTFTMGNDMLWQSLF
jgi:hypothetical protein